MCDFSTTAKKSGKELEEEGTTHSNSNNNNAHHSTHALLLGVGSKSWPSFVLWTMRGKEYNYKVASFYA